MASNYGNGDLGIVLYLAGTPSGITYVDRDGVTQNAETLDTNYHAMSALLPVDTSRPFAGYPADHTLFCRLDFSSATSITIKLEQRYSNDPRIDLGWMAVQTVRQDTGIVLAEHTFNAPALPATTLYVAIQTASAHLSGQIQVSAKAAGAGFTANDRVEVAIRCL